MKKLLLIGICLSVAACGSFPIAVMHNDKTGDTVKCEPGEYYRAFEPWAYNAQLERCVSGYEAAGYNRVDKDKK